jgi:hypothetical protein
MEAKAGRRRHIIRRMCDQGDAVTTWETGADTETDEEAQAAIREAERIFREALVRGDVPFAIDADKAPEKLERWDARAKEADEIVIAPRLMGG